MASRFASPTALFRRLGLGGLLAAGLLLGGGSLLAQTPGTERWAFKPEIPGAWTGAAVGPDGSVYVGYCATNGTGHVLALDPVTGVERWRFGSGCIVSIPAVGPDGTVYVAEGDKVVALNGVTGESRWSFAGGGVFDSSPALATDGTVYLGCNDGRLYALDASTGAKRWDFSTGAAIHEAPALAADGLVYFGSNDGNFYALDTATGAKLWHFPTGGPIACSPAIGSDGTVYFGSGDKKFYAVNGRTGARRWDFTTLAPVDWSPVMVDDMVIFGAKDAQMYSVDAENGHFCWFLPFTTSITRAHPAVGGDGDLYVGVPTALVAMDHNSKFANWVYFLGTERSLAPVLGPDGTVFVGSYKGAFYGLWSRGAGGLADTPWPMAGQNIRRCV